MLGRCARGNSFADGAAKLGVLMQLALAAVDTSVSAYLRKQRRVAMTIANVGCGQSHRQVSACDLG